MNVVRSLVWVTFGSAIAILTALVVSDIQRGHYGDTYYYRYYVPYTSPAGSDALISRIRNLPVGMATWLRSGAGCEYLIEHKYDQQRKTHHGVVHGAHSRWGLPCHKGTGAFIIADADPRDGFPGVWTAKTIADGVGYRLLWVFEPAGG